MNRTAFTSILIAFALAGCAGSGNQFVGWQQEKFGETQVTASATRVFTLGNAADSTEQHILAVMFDRGSNAAGHFRIDKIMVGNSVVGAADIVVPPGSSLNIQVTYAPMDLETSVASYGGWETGQRKRWVPINPEDAGKEPVEPVIHRALIETTFDRPSEGIHYMELVGEAAPGPNGEIAAGGAGGACTPGGGTACYTGGFSLDIPQLAPGGPKPLEISGPIKMNISGGSASMRMDDFPLVIFYLRSGEIKQLPSGVTATLVISGAPGVSATGTFDGARLDLKGVAFRIRVATGELTLDQVKQGMSALVDFNIPDLEIKTIKPYNQGAITLHMETALSANPSGNELFDQFLSGAKVIAIMEGELAF